MTVGELIDKLLEFDDDLEVRFEEGSGYTEVTEVTLRPRDLPEEPFVSIE
jgi:hypothetical protein